MDLFKRPDYERLNAEFERVQDEMLNALSEREQFLDRNIPELLVESDSDDLLYLGGHFIPVSEMRGSIFSQGVSRSGKTHQIKASIATALSSLRKGKDRRVLIADPKQDMLPFVDSLTRKYRIPLYYFNISDRRSVVLDIARDLGGRSDVFREASKMLVPEPKSGEPFWAQVAQTIIHAGMLVLQKERGYKWGLHDLYGLALCDVPSLLEFLSFHPSGQVVAARYFPDNIGDNTKFGFLSQVATSLAQIESAAAAQYYTPRSKWLSLRWFLQNNCVLLLGTDSSTRKSTNPIVQLMIRLLVNSLSELPDRRERKCFFFLDELPFWGKLSGLEELLTFAPSKGAITYLVVQDIRHLAQIYGENMAETIAGMCQTKLIFTPASERSAEWSVAALGKYRFKEYRYSHSWSGGSFSENVNEAYENSYPLTTGELRELGIADPRHGSRFVLVTPWSGMSLEHMSASEIDYWKPPESDVPLRVRRPRREFQCPLSLNAQRRAFKGKIASQRIKREFLDGYKSAPPLMQELARQTIEAFQEVCDSI